MTGKTVLIILAFLVVATTLEVSGDALVRNGIAALAPNGVLLPWVAEYNRPAVSSAVAAEIDALRRLIAITVPARTDQHVART